MEAFTREHHNGGTRRQSRKKGDHLVGRTAYMHIQAVGTNLPKVIQYGSSKRTKWTAAEKEEERSSHNSSQIAGG